MTLRDEIYDGLRCDECAGAGKERENKLRDRVATLETALRDVNDVLTLLPVEHDCGRKREYPDCPGCQVKEARAEIAAVLEGRDK